MKEIKLNHGLLAKVDDEDYDYLNQFTWHAHKVINKTPIGKVCDHKDHDGLNNQKSNIRNCSRAENGRNVYPKSGHTSIFKGVHFNKDNGKWMARITINKKLNYLGIYSTEIEAARVYNNKAIELHGEFAKLNIIQ